MNPAISFESGRRNDVDDDWKEIAALFSIRPGTTYLNHGSFGITSRPVLEAQSACRQRLEQQPMDFYVRQYEPLWFEAIDRLAEFVGTAADNLVFAENATFAMNIVADSFPLSAGDEVLSSNHEYGAVHRIWERACQRRDARLVVARLPDHFESVPQLVEAIFAPATPRTRLLIVSHITSPTALIMPVQEICAEARRLGIHVCIDGPHAPAHVPLDLGEMGCAFYTASCHKWLSAPLGSGFLFADPEFHEQIQPPLKSWGRLLPHLPHRWYEEFIWSGTRDPSGCFAIPVAIELMEQIGLDVFRNRVRTMAAETTKRLVELTGQTPIGVDSDHWYGSMAHVPLPPGDWSELQSWLWESHGIEVPVIDFENRWYIRVSHHLYNTRTHIDHLLAALATRFDR